jgi:hypothetical protein
MVSFILLAPIFIFPILWLIAVIVREVVEVVAPPVRQAQSHRDARTPEWDDRMFR